MLKKTLVAAAFAVAGSLTLAEPAPTPAPSPSPLTSELFKVLMAVSTEARAVYRDQRDAVKILDALTRLEYSPELRPRLLAVFGTERPLQFKRLGAAKGQVNYAAVLLPHLYREGDKEFEWSALNLKASASANGRTLSTGASWPSLAIRTTDPGSGNLAVMRDMSFSSKVTRGADAMWYGASQARLGSIDFDDVKLKANGKVETGDNAKVEVAVATPEGKSHPMRIEDVVARSSLRAHGKLADLAYQLSIAAIGVGDQKIERLNTSVRVLDIDAVALAAFRQGIERQDAAGMTPEQQGAAVMTLMKEFGKNQIKRGAVILIDDISGRYHGATVSLKGRISFDHLDERDFDNPMLVLRKANLRLEVRVPLALVKEAARGIAKSNVPPAGVEKAADYDIDKAAGDVNAAIIGKLVGEGYAQIDKAALATIIEFKGGKLTANGKEIDTAVMAALAAQHAPPPQAQP